MSWLQSPPRNPPCCSHAIDWQSYVSLPHDVLPTYAPIAFEPKRDHSLTPIIYSSSLCSTPSASLVRPATPFSQVFPMLPTQAAVAKEGPLHVEGVRNISAYLSRARAKGAQVIFVAAKGDAGRIALYSALGDAGFLGEGFAVVDGQMMALSNDLISSGKQAVQGILHMSIAEPHACKATAGCPREACGTTSCAAPSRFMNQAHDAVYTLAKALAPLFRDGGSNYLAGVPESRLAAMAAIRATALSSDSASSGALSFQGGSNNRKPWQFEYKIWNIQGSPPANVAVGRVSEDGFQPIAGAANVLWPGGTSKIPQDSDSLTVIPTNVSIGWVVEMAWGTPALRQESRMYAQQAIDEINDDLFILQNTHLHLEVDETVHNNVKTTEAFNAIEVRAAAAGRPLAAVLAMSSSHMATIYAPQANVAVTQQSSGVPIVGFYTGAGELSDPTRFKNFIRLYPPVSETQHAFEKVILKFGWSRVGLLCDKTDAYR